MSPIIFRKVKNWKNHNLFPEKHFRIIIIAAAIAANLCVSATKIDEVIENN